MKLLLHGGVTRMVLLTKGYAFKVPTLMYGWKMFLYGLLGNINERAWSGQRGLCPVLWSYPGGLLNIMPFCRELTDEEFSHLVPKRWGKGKARLPDVESKSSSFGWLAGKIVAIDYGGFGWEAERCMFCKMPVWRG